MKRPSAIAVILLCVIVALALSRPIASSHADDEPRQASQSERDRWMAVKLASSQQILEYLTSADFDHLQTAARRMLVLNFLEQWVRDKNISRKSEYQGQLNAFEYATKELIRHADDEDIQGALKSYTALTESCVRCHQLIRDVDSE